MRTAGLFVTLFLMLGLVAACGGGSSSEVGDDTLSNEDTTGLEEDIPPCEAQCPENYCGGDGCGNLCQCEDEGATCTAENICCVPVCGTNVCGDDGCGGTCGSCEDGYDCVGGQCQEVEDGDCTDKQCGPDGAGGSCGLCPCVGCDPNASFCSEEGLCIAPPDQLSCEGIVECMNNCPENDDACPQECFNNGSEQGAYQLQMLISCLDQNGYFECADDQCMTDIMNGACYDAAMACFGGGSTGDLTCDEIVECMNNCAEGDDTCPQDCFDSGTYEGQSQLQGLINCLDQNGYFECGDDQCMTDIMNGACYDAAVACFGGGSTGDLTCDEIVECMNNCADGDDACPQDCFSNGTYEGQSQLQSLINCLDQNGYFECGDDQCMTDIMNGACYDTAVACFGGGSTGELTCDEIVECMNNCAEGDDACPQDCFNNGSTDGQAQLQALINCLDQNGYFECGDDQCMTDIMNGACYDTAVACFGGGSTGDLTCDGIVECMNNCAEGDDACPQACFDSGSTDGQAQLQALINCLDQNGYFECADDACMADIMNGACYETAATCFGGGSTGELTCNDIVECMNACAEGDDTCPQACFESGSAEGQTQLQTLITCLDDNGYFECADDACMNDIMNGACYDDALVCFGTVTTGDLACDAIVDCMNACDEADDTCPQTCFESGTAEGQALLQALITCLDDNGYFECADDACMNDIMNGVCLDAAVGCFGAIVTTGDLTCDEVVTCMNECAEGDEECPTACFYTGTAEAQAQLQTLLTCLDDNGYFECADDACMNDIMNGVCLESAEGCFGPLTGDATCVELFACSDTCFDLDQGIYDDACLQDCYTTGTAEAQGQYTALLTCLEDNGYSYFECTTEDCSADALLTGACLEQAGPCVVTE